MHFAFTLRNFDRSSVSAILVYQCVDIFVQVECVSSPRSVVGVGSSSAQLSAESAEWVDRWNRFIEQSN